MGIPGWYGDMARRRRSLLLGPEPIYEKGSVKILKADDLIGFVVPKKRE